MLEVVVFYLVVSLMLYLVLGGADFGAGLLEAFLRGPQSQRQAAALQKAIAPVWEANHIWLILAVVILFNGFPPAFAQISTTYHIPLTFMLVGIILRGSAYVFRHYDEVTDGAQQIYARVFIGGSIIAPFSLGVIAGGLLLGRAPLPAAGKSFAEVYVLPWATSLSVTVGLFLCVLSAYLACALVIGSSGGEVRRSFQRVLVKLALVLIASGLFVFAAAFIEGLPLLSEMLERPLALLCFVGATLLFAALALSIVRDIPWLGRIAAAGQAVLILLGWLAVQFPHLMKVPGTRTALTIYNTGASPAVLQYLGGALLIGSVLILPAFFLLLRIFSSPQNPPSSDHRA